LKNAEVPSNRQKLEVRTEKPRQDGTEAIPRLEDCATPPRTALHKLPQHSGERIHQTATKPDEHRAEQFGKTATGGKVFLGHAGENLNGSDESDENAGD